LTGFIAASPEHMVDLIRPGGAVDMFDRVRCRQRAIERFSADRMVEDHVGLYERVRTTRTSAQSRHRPDPRMVA